MNTEIFMLKRYTHGKRISEFYYFSREHPGILLPEDKEPSAPGRRPERAGIHGGAFQGARGGDRAIEKQA